LWIIALGVSLVALVAFFLWVPLDIILDIDMHGRPRVTGGYSWCYGLVRREFKHRPGKKPPPQKPPGRRRFPDIRRAWRMLTVRGLLNSLFRLGRGTLASFQWTGLSADFRVGLGDPADTGMLFAVLGPAAAILGPSVFERVRVRPAFEDDLTFEGYSRGRARLRPIRLLLPLLRFTFSRPAARALWRLLADRLKRKKR
jgi:hypothetical protein